jgi:hypothetical protein
MADADMSGVYICFEELHRHSADEPTSRERTLVGFSGFQVPGWETDPCTKGASSPPRVDW